MTDSDFDGVPRHPLADQFTMPNTDTPGHCACGAVLPPMREWEDYPHQWAHITCKGCGRGFVDEDDYIAVYDDGLDIDDDVDLMAQAERDEEMPDIELGEPNIWDRIGTMRWQHVVLAVLAVSAFVALCFAPAATCSLRISDSPTTTTTVQR